MLKEPACSPEGPRNIVVLSDGTGNSSGSVWRTNVWRMYEALDLSTGSQLALYDNGVGTSAFRPLAILGGALGWGLKRNVRDLYTFVCRNYRPKGGERLHADRIYAMGFSRGAFTIRVLVDLIGHQGLITGATGRELDRRAKWAYREYRKQFKSRLHLVSMCRWIRDKLLGLIERGKPKYDSEANLKVPVTFMGLWDTVDAYGLPIDEMTRGWDQWVWPLKMDSLTPPSHVNKICHAIALDDERHTFHPVLLDEANLKEHDHIDKEKVTQVWFAGVHSNVGGSYPDDSLAHVPLRWMAAEAQKQGLHLHQVYTTVWEARCDPHGPIYDSRRGLGSYYRYNPRSIARLTKDDFAKVSIPRPKIHCSVFQRIAAGRDEYAPLVLPDRYAVVDDAGAVIDFDPKFGENHTQAKERAVAQERVWDRVWVRRVLYFATVITTVLVVLPPLIMDADSGGILPFLPWKPRTLQGAVDLLGNVVPSMLQSMVAYYRELPLQLFVPGGLILLLMFASTRVQRAAADRMRELWTGGGKRSEPNGLIYKVRTHKAYRRTFQTVTQHIFPFVFGMLALGIALVTVTGTVNRGGFALASAGGFVCKDPLEPSGRTTPLQQITGTKTSTFSNREPCFFTGLALEAGVAYRATVRIGEMQAGKFTETNVWWDNEHPVCNAEGFSTGDNLLVAPFLPFRRVLTARWFVPVIRIGSYAAEYHVLNNNAVDFTPGVGGPVFLFVNDAIGPGPLWQYFYRNNDDRLAEVSITRVVQPIPAAPASQRISADDCARLAATHPRDHTEPSAE